MEYTLRTACVASIIAALLCACSGGPGAGVPGAVDSNSVVRPQTLKSKDFKQRVAWGAKGKAAVAQCPQGYKVIAGGSSSSDGSFVGTGYANQGHSAWIVKPRGSAAAEAFATCIGRNAGGANFTWRTGYPASGLSSAQCRVGSILITGYGTGTVTDSWFDPNTNKYWVAGGGLAYASCAHTGAGILIKHAWNQSQHPKAVFAGCGTGYTVIGGAMGDNAWPGPPIQQHPGVPSSPGVQGYRGWWTFSNAKNELTWAACVQE